MQDGDAMDEMTDEADLTEREIAAMWDRAEAVDVARRPPRGTHGRRPLRGGRGQIYRRDDGRWAFRIKTANGKVVATDAGMGYATKSGARATLESLLAGDYNGPIEVEDRTSTG